MNPFVTLCVQCIYDLYKECHTPKNREHWPEPPRRFVHSSIRYPFRPSLRPLPHHTSNVTLNLSVVEPFTISELDMKT